MREFPADLDLSRSTWIEQGYIAIADDGTEVRVRRRDGAAVFTVKSGSGRSRFEEEIAIDPERFARLWPVTEGGDGDGPAVVLTSGRDRRDLEPLICESGARGFIAKEKLSPAALGELLW